MDEQTSPEDDAGTETQEQTPAPEKSSGRSPLVIVAIVGAVLAFFGLVCAGMGAAIAIPNFVAMQYRAKRAEVPSNVNAIKTAQLAYDAAFDEFIPTSTRPRSIEMLDGEQHSWSSGSGFDTLGWSPDGNVRGTYKVEVAPGGRDFIVHGWIDVDGDGFPAHYTATKSVNAMMVTPNDVY